MDERFHMTSESCSRHTDGRPSDHRLQWLIGTLICVLACGCGPSREQTLPPKAPSTAGAGRQPAAEEVAFENKEVTQADLQAWIDDPALRRLRVPGTDLSDTALSQLASHTKLELLDVTNCESIGAAGFKAIGQMTSLRHLRVSGTAVTDQTAISLSGLTNLAALSLQHTAVTDDGLLLLASMPKLKELNLYGTPITDASLETIAGLPVLQKLRLRGTGVTGENADAFAKMANVVDLDLSETSFVSEGLTSVSNMPSLRLLNLWLTKVDDKGIAALESQLHLTQLNLDNVSGITDQSLDTIHKMTDLELLHLGGTSITSAGLPKLHNLKKLKTLFITRLSLAPSDVQSLRQAMPWITRLES